ncbi:MAG: cytochrome c biogenesis protein ResB [Chloroflexota bacterium]|nr:cytochrome c biogenesis protein ResB [Chloroflexota bacterium]
MALALLGLSLAVTVLSGIRPVVRWLQAGTIGRESRRVLPRGVWVPASSGANLEALEVNLRATLRARGYSTTSVVTERSAEVRAHEHLWSKHSTIVAHLGALLVICASAVSAVTGFREDGLRVVEGSTVPLGHGASLRLAQHDFAERWQRGASVPSDLVSDVSLLDGNRVVREHYQLRVNSPLRYAGVAFHLQAYGPALDALITDADGTVLYRGGIPLPHEDGASRPYGYLSLRGYELKFTLPRANGTDLQIPAGTTAVEARYRDQPGGVHTASLVEGDTTSLAGLQLRFDRERQYAELAVSRQPAAPFVWLGMLLVLGGVVVRLHRPHRELRVRVRIPLRNRSMGVEVAAVRGRWTPAELQEVKRVALLEARRPPGGSSVATPLAMERPT